MFTTTLKYSWAILLWLSIGFSSCGDGKPITPAQPTEEAPAPLATNAALEEATARVAQEPENAQLYIDRALIHYKLQNFDAAITDLDNAISLSDTIAKAYLLLGDVYFAKRDITRAIKSLEAGAEALPQSKEIALVLSRYYFYNSEHDKSIKFADAALRIDPGYAQAYFQKASIFLEMKDTAKAISNLQTAVEQDPEFDEAYTELGLLLSKKKDKLAVQYLQNAVSLDPRDNDARYALALALQDHKRYTEALEQYREIIKQSPQYENAHYGMGWVYFQMDSINQADAAFKLATSIKPDFTDAYYMRGLVAESVGDYKSAEYYYDQTLRIDAQHMNAIAGFNRLKQLRK
ncbi:tetratricopeptide repeat protein [soil metagenome]